MSLNLDKNKTVLVHAYKEVLDERNPINWALYGYDAQTYDLNLVSKGDGGLEEMVEDFNSGKIQYALCRVEIKERNVEKIAIINWQGEGAPLARKGMCANHVDTIRNFFKGVHVSLHARTDEDVEPDLIMQMVSKAIAGDGIKMSSTIEDTDLGPVGAIYKKVNPQEEINAKAKDDFWRRDQAEQERVRREENNRQRKFSQDEVKLLRKESQDYFDKEERQLEKEKQVADQKRIKHSPSPSPMSPSPQVNGFSTANGNGNKSNSPSPVPPHQHAAAVNNSAERAAALLASTPMKNSNSDLVRKRIKSFDGGSGPVFPQAVTTNNKTPNRSSLKNSNQTPPASIPIVSERSPNSAPVNGTSSLSVLKRKQMFESGNSAPVPSPDKAVVKRNPAEEIRLAQEEEARKKAELEQKEEKVVAEVAEPVSEERVTSPVAHFEPLVTQTSIPQQQQQQPAFFSNPTSLKSPSPQPPKSPSPSKFTEEIDDFVEHINNEHEPYSTKQIQQQQQPKANGVSYNNTNKVDEMEIEDASSPVPSESNGDTITINITGDMGTCARALYDYQAADETEISFDPGDIIRNIEKIDEGWWEGLGPGEQYGLFPANYVELLN